MKVQSLLPSFLLCLCFGACSPEHGQSGSEISCQIGQIGDNLCQDSLGDNYFCGEQGVCTPRPDVDAGEPAPDTSVAPDGAMRAFVTYPIYKGDFAVGLGEPTIEADRICQVQADAQAIGGQWMAWLSSDSSVAPTRLIGEGPWISMADEGPSTLFLNRAQLEAGPQSTEWLHPDGSTTAGSLCSWSGTTARGDVANTCQNWTSNTGPGTAGSTIAVLDRWTDNGSEDCFSSCAFYCFETR
ncbi:MAG: hypothetical protein JKY56_13465 [Kofleriaceae bacterium]|nr:hypothetical protein [Kofleriaceae bacterium]